MASPPDRMMPEVFRRGAFDPDWYTRAYPDVAELGMKPEAHYRRYGFAMQRMPNAEAGPMWRDLRLQLHPPPLPNAALLEAGRLADIEGYETAIPWAERHFPSQTTHTIDVLRANAAIAAGDRDAWLMHLNGYIDTFGAAPLQLSPGETLFDQLDVQDLPAVTGGPLVSVIVPVWNAKETLRGALGSILKQTWRNLEVLIVDDASTDGSWEIAQWIAATDDRVRLMRNARNVGPYVSKNTALQQAQGAWITGHDSDDWAHPQWIEYHLGAVLAAPVPPEVSLPVMLRMAPDGRLVRFMALQASVLDGAARSSLISTVFEAHTLKERLGGWDCIRFGADAEMIGRVRQILPSEPARLPVLSILGLDLATGLTNDPVSGLTGTEGLSPPRRAYIEAYRVFHENLAEHPGAARYAFPPDPQAERPFPAPPEATVPVADILANQPRP